MNLTRRCESNKLVHLLQCADVHILSIKEMRSPCFYCLEPQTCKQLEALVLTSNVQNDGDFYGFGEPHHTSAMYK
jgi:hypothetical protein